MTANERLKMDLVLARFVEAMTSWNFSPLTIQDYARSVRFFFDWLSTETEVTTLVEITPGTLGAYAVSLLEVRKEDGSALSPVTRSHRLVPLKSLFRWLTREGLLLTNPAAGIELPKVRQRLPARIPTPKEMLRLIERVGSEGVLAMRDRAILEVFYSTGMRLSELQRLTIADYDPEAGTLTIRGGKGGKDRVVPLGAHASEALNNYIARARPKLVGQRSGSVLFLSRKRRPYSACALRQMIKRAGRSAGISKHLHPHKLRHACATHMLAGGADIRHIQTLLGHALLSTTQLYTRVEITDLKRVHRKFHPRERRGK